MVAHVAVLGAGIMGASTALLLARRGVRVVVVDAAERPVDRASRWNEGKIHLGYLYAGDASLETARRVLPGGLAFKPLVESLIAEAIDEAVTAHDDTFLVHARSVADVDRTAAYFDAVTRLVAEHPDRARYLAPLTTPSVHRLTSAELEAIADPSVIVGAFRVPERSVSTTWVADRLAGALLAEPAIEVRMETRVTGVCRERGGLYVRTLSGRDGPYDAVVNALWEGRLAVDASAGVRPPSTWSHRHRLSLFVRTSRPLDVPSAVICTGPFGDVKNYNGRDFYLSWYPAGLQVDSSSLEPPAPPPLDADARRQLAALVIAQLASRLPRVYEIGECLESCRIEGGWVYAAGAGRLDDPASTLHRRDRIGIRRDGQYVSIDTGKYSIAPWLASQVAADLTA
jgi:glycine/D-amino acid oxidase-like deaminating enzyme